MRIPYIGLGVAALLLAGCTKEAERVGAGTYKLEVDNARVPAQPGGEGATRTGDLEATLELENDGTYSFEVDMGERDISSEGNWSLQGSNLTLTPTQVEVGGQKQANPEPSRGTLDTTVGTVRLTVDGRDVVLTRTDRDSGRGTTRPSGTSGTGTGGTGTGTGTGATGGSGTGGTGSGTGATGGTGTGGTNRTGNGR